MAGQEVQERPLIIAHRGFSAIAPENTLVAQRMAAELGVDLIECDVHRTKDGQIVVMHDATVDRTTDGSGALAEMTLAELKALDAGSWKGPKYAGERVPTLAESLELIGERARLIIEIKAEGIADEVLRVVEECEALDRVVIFSFDYETVCRARELRPELPCLWLTGGAQDPSAAAAAALVEKVERGRLTGISPSYAGATDELLRQCREKGLWLWTWTLDEPEQMKEAIARRVGAIGTNWPDRLRKVLGLS